MTDLLPMVENRLGEVGVRLTQTTGGQALCRLDGHMASAKELEGRMAVLLELRRTLRNDPQADTSEIMVLRADDLAAGPVARILLPERMGVGTHACWVEGDRMRDGAAEHDRVEGVAHRVERQLCGRA